MAPRVAPGRAPATQPAATAGARVPGLLVPAPNQIITIDRYPQSPFDPRSTEMALHQIHTRSPRRVPVPLPGSSSPTTGQYHQAVRAILVGPSSVGTVSRSMKYNFDVPVEILLRLSKAVHPMGAHQPAVGYWEGALRYRFRMCAIPASKADSVTANTWVTTATNWPEHVFVTFNDTAVPIRRKTHHGASQPVELTPLLQLGVNRLHVSVMHPPKPKDNLVYFAAVELVETRSAESIREHILEHNTIPASVTSNLVAERLKPAEGGDELMIVDNTVSIDLSDPFTMRMFKVPVRGVKCTHLECFDLDTWLETRTGKPLCHHRGRGMCEACRPFESLGPEPTYADGWKCPICSSDARPRSLRVDLFLCHVRDQLIGMGKEGAKSISVNPDGSWVPRIEEDLDSDDDDGPSAKRRRSDGPGKDRGPGPAIEVIALD
ncbi:hypothetical protein F5X68DRAFT_229669 [Plectosphaerella plurivora]|uniref:ZMIZ1/ZMIZ2 GBD-like domain-containing protein n=1 Tax=Plectosphaerella plurivora TaxID=936078 RepID=A0A9P8VFS9_9PEZI|nr:hypothetical protein F5X68DRAFT_229669 [Plectosphaerella plurivora]